MHSFNNEKEKTCTSFEKILEMEEKEHELIM